MTGSHYHLARMSLNGNHGHVHFGLVLLQVLLPKWSGDTIV